jgi:hypothetical protein
VLPWAGAAVVVEAPAVGLRVELSPSFAHALEARAGILSPLEEHVREMRLVLGGDLEHFDTELARIQTAGLLLPESRLLRKAGTVTPPLAIHSIAIPTRNRPRQLEIAARTMAENLRAYGRRARFVVADDSNRPELAKQNIDALRAIEKEFDAEIAYADHASVERFAAALSQASGIELDLVRFALRDPEGAGYSAGAVRNQILVECAGEAFLSIDDDICCSVRGPGLDETQFYISDASDPMESTFFASYEDALASTTPLEADLLGLHECTLGRSLLDLPWTRGATQRIPLSIEWSLAHGGSILLTPGGFLGDNGTTFRSQVLFQDPRKLSSLFVSEAHYRACLASRQVTCRARGVVVAETNSCQSLHLGVDHRELLPPFFPIFRGQDYLFKELVRQTARARHIASLPWMLSHVPEEKRTHEVADLKSEASRLMMFGLLLGGLLRRIGSNLPTADTRTVLIAIGTNLAAWAEARESAYRDAIRTAALEDASGLFRHFAAAREHPAAPNGFHDDLDQFEAALAHALRDDRFFACSEPLFQKADDPIRLQQKLIRRFASLLMAWPRLIETARLLRADGTSAFSTIS